MAAKKIEVADLRLCLRSDEVAAQGITFDVYRNEILADHRSGAIGQDDRCSSA